MTGASGHLGYHIAKLLTEEKHSVRAFVRKTSYQDRLKELPLTIVYGDVFNMDSLQRAMDGIDTVFHTAAVYNLSPADNHKIIETAVRGTKNIFEAASKTKTAAKIIYTSTAGTVGSSADKKRLLDESNYAKDSGLFPYIRAKIEAENAAIESAKKYGIRTIICNPSVIVGKDDYKLTPSNEMLLTLNKFNMIYVDSGHSLVYVEDAARGHINAARYGRNLERYLLSGDNVELKTLIQKINKIYNRKIPLIRLNRPVFLFVSLGLEVIAKMTGKDPSLTRTKAGKTINKFSFYDNSKAKKELNFYPRKLDSYLKETLDWLLRRYTRP
ncbi:MAG: NAD-dependent epimerase/dehydratase family protein [Candidatus Omnitrophota bacterium]